MPRPTALNNAMRRAETTLYVKGDGMPTVERAQRAHDEVTESLKLKTLVSVSAWRADLRLTDHELDNVVRRTLELFKDTCEVRIFGARYLYHKDLPKGSLDAAIKMKENYTKLVSGAKNRIGHNWEACVDWYIQLVSPKEIEFREQHHRSNNRMDPRRITIALIKSVGHRQRAAELDRVWTAPNGFTKPPIYVLECKQSLVRKTDLDDFLEVLRWSMEFGVDRDDGGRELKNGVIPIFAAATFNPRDKVKMRDGEELSLAAYVERLNIQILKASVMNEKLRERGISSRVSVQKICRYYKDEQEVRDLLNRIWLEPSNAEAILAEVTRNNAEIYE